MFDLESIKQIFTANEAMIYHIKKHLSFVPELFNYHRIDKIVLHNNNTTLWIKLCRVRDDEFRYINMPLELINKSVDEIEEFLVSLS